MQQTPCAHLIEKAQPACELGYGLNACRGCQAYSPGLNDQERTRCEVWTRVMGYHRPVSAFNVGKQQEHRERKLFRERPDITLREGAGHD